MRRLLAVVAAMGLAAGCQDDVTGVAGDTAAVTGGTNDTEYVGACEVKTPLPPTPDNPMRDPLYCTCTVMSGHPDVVLTAAHCIYDADKEEFLTGTEVFFGRSVDESMGIPVAKAVPHRYFDNAAGARNDIALLVLSEPAPADAEAIPLNEEAMGQDDVNQPIILVGYGEDESGDVGSRHRLDDPDVVVTQVKPTYLNAGISAKTTCHGDGGGPGFMDLGAGEVQVSVNSRNGQCSTIVQRTRVDPYVLSFIYPFLDARSGPCAKDDVCVTDGCRTPDPDCDDCSNWNDTCGQDCPTHDWDCPPGVYPGDPCEHDGDCEEGGRCVAAHDDATFLYCTATCDPAGDPCPGGMVCQDGDRGPECVFDPTVPSPGSQGYECTSNSECRSSICEELICVFPCGAGSTCPDPYQCGPSQVQAGTDVCLGEVISGGGGFCAEAPRRDGRGTWAAGGLLLLAAAATALRRRRARRERA